MDKNKIVTVLSKGLLGSIPVIGPLAAEIIGEIIPNQRLERIEKTLKLLEIKLKNFGLEDKIEKLKDPDRIDLLEDSFLMAARALSAERLDYITSLIKNSLSDENYEYLRYKKLINLLNDVNDMEILLLIYHSYKETDEKYNEFVKKHEEIVKPPIVYSTSPDDEHLKKAIYEVSKSKLIELGLITLRYKKPKKGMLPEFDLNTGTIKSNGVKLTLLGNHLLKIIDKFSE